MSLSARERLNQIPEALRDTLLPYQKDSVRYALKHNGRILIADDMGLGKTIQSIACACLYKESWPVIVLCPASVCYQWRDEWMRFCPAYVSARSDCQLVLTTNQVWDDAASITIMSYDIAVRRSSDLVKMRGRVVIVDECHMLRNAESKRVRTLAPHIKASERAFFLSGTPATSRPIELWTQVNMLHPKVFRCMHQFARAFCAPRRTPWGWDYRGSSNEAQLDLLLKETCMIRRLKTDVGIELPSKTRYHVTLGEVDDFQAQLDQYRKHVRLMSDETKTDASRCRSKKAAESCLMQLFNDTAPVKIPSVLQYLNDFVETKGTKPFLIFAHHMVFMDALEAWCDEHGLSYIRIDGTVTSAQRNIRLERFHSGQAQVALLSIMACNAGLNLTEADEAIFAELFWIPGVLAQCEDRIHRIKQQVPCTMRYLLLDGTSDTCVYKLLERKKRVLAACLDTNKFEGSAVFVEE